LILTHQNRKGSRPLSGKNDKWKSWCINYLINWTEAVLFPVAYSDQNIKHENKKTQLLRCTLAILECMIHTPPSHNINFRRQCFIRISYLAVSQYQFQETTLCKNFVLGVDVNWSLHKLNHFLIQVKLTLCCILYKIGGNF